MHKFSPSFSKELIKWFANNRRDMPWRKKPSLYRVWISEIMLQQTRVEQATPHFNRWIKIFPSLKSLINANEQEVLKAWEGLGYYSRARNIYKSAQIIKNQHNGRFPRDPIFIESLPGIGPYTKAAICSISLNLDFAVLDGNVMRVLARYFCIDKNIDKLSTQKYMQSIVDEMLPKGKAAEFNEGMMELGALICKPTNPKCDICPVKNNCRSRISNDILSYPVKNKKNKIPHLIVGAAVIKDPKKGYLVAQRNKNKMLGGLWEFPGGKKEKNESIKKCITRELKEELNIKINVGSKISKFHHLYSHFSIELHAYHANIIEGKPKAMEGQLFKWIKLKDIRNLPYSKVDLKIIEALENPK
ncbi:MAG: A/G-specific adenine glycosylase [Verrucomicrobiota bacterium]|nr:A/G-specific adenine glycosylase [Verrucomicrobiota bacterium]